MSIRFWYITVRLFRFLRNKTGDLHTLLRKVVIWAENHYLDAQLERVWRMRT